MTPAIAADPIEDWAQTRNLLRETIAALDAAAVTLKAPGTPSALQLSRRLERFAGKLRRPFRIAVAGEFNTGKSTLCNRLIGLEALPTSALPTTNLGTRLYRASRLEVHARRSSGERVRVAADNPAIGGWSGIEVGIPADTLDGIELIDLPGLADPRFGRSVTLVRELHPDMVLWCSSSTQACKESERSEWSELPATLLSRSLLILTHADLIKSATDRAKLLLRVNGMVGTTFGGVVTMSSKTSGPEDVDGLWRQIFARASMLGRQRCTLASRLAHRTLSRSAPKRGR